MRWKNFRRSCEHRQWWAIMLAMFCICGFHSAQAELKVTEKFEYYTIKAETKSQLHKALHNAAIDVDGFKANAVAYSNITWEFYAKSSGSRCRLDRIKVKLDIIYAMPKLITSNARMKSDWDNRGYPKLLKHEKGHGKLSLLVAEDINELFYGMKPSNNCDKLAQNADQQAKQLIEKLKRAHIYYDEKTEHGLKDLYSND